MARDLNTILSADWIAANVTKPPIINEKITMPSLNLYTRCIAVKRARKITEAMGIVERTRYTPDSHIAWEVRIVAKTLADLEDMINEVQRICAAFATTTTEKQLIWENGDIIPLAWRFQFDTIIFVRISGMKIG